MRFHPGASSIFAIKHTISGIAGKSIQLSKNKNETFICRYRHTTPLGNCLHLQIKVSTLFLILILKYYNIKNSICQELDKPPSGFQRLLIQVIAQSLASTSNMNTSEQFRFNLTNSFFCYIKFFCRFY